MKIYRLIFVLVCGLTLFLLKGETQAQGKYPNRAIELVVPMGAGGATDIICRVYSEELARILQVPVTVVNRPGGSGIQGTAYVTRAKKDGYTLLHSSEGAIITLPIISKEVPYDPLKELFPMGNFTTAPSVIAVKSDSPFKTLNDLVEYARKNPGKLKSTSGFLWNASHVDLEIFCANTKIKIPTIPYEAGGEAIAALLGGHVDLVSLTISTVKPHIKAGKIRGLVYTSKIKSPELPDIPNTAELGYPSENFTPWFGIFAPAGLPQPVLDVLIPAVEKTFKNPEVVQKAASLDYVSKYMNPEEFRRFIEEQTRVLRRIAETALIKK